MIQLLLFFLVGVFKACMDTVQFHYFNSIFLKYSRRFFDASISWKNKYVDFDSKNGRRKWYGIIIPVAFTDAWHLFQSIMLLVLYSAIALAIKYPLITYLPYGFIIDALLYRIMFQTGFYLFYKYFLVKK